MAYKRKDYFFNKAKKEKFVARSIYKLEEIDDRFRLFRGGEKVLDLGAAPGSWSQYAARVIGPKGRLLGVDLQAVRVSLPNAVFVQGDFREMNMTDLTKEYGFEPPFDIVMSDMAPNTTGIRITDQARSFELCELALETAKIWLRPGGHFVCKLFHSPDFDPFRKALKKAYDRVEAVRPESTRKESKEIFLVGMSKKKI